MRLLDGLERAQVRALIVCSLRTQGYDSRIRLVWGEGGQLEMISIGLVLEPWSFKRLRFWWYGEKAFAPIERYVQRVLIEAGLPSAAVYLVLEDPAP